MTAVVCVFFVVSVLLLGLLVLGPIVDLLFAAAFVREIGALVGALGAKTKDEGTKPSDKGDGA